MTDEATVDKRPIDNRPIPDFYTEAGSYAAIAIGIDRDSDPRGAAETLLNGYRAIQRTYHEMDNLTPRGGFAAFSHYGYGAVEDHGASRRSELEREVSTMEQEMQTAAQYLSPEANAHYEARVQEMLKKQMEGMRGR